MYVTKNYMTDSGDKLVIGGTLEVEDGAMVVGLTAAVVVDDLTTEDAGKALSAKQGKVLKGLVDGAVAIEDVADDLITDDAAKVLSANQGKVLNDKVAGMVAAFQAVSTATEVAGLVADFNALLAKLKAAGLMADGE